MKIVDPRVDPELVPSGSRAVVIAEHQPEFQDLPSIRTPDGKVITRWEPSDEERRMIAEGTDIFVTILANGPINPLFVSIGPCNWKG